MLFTLVTWRIFQVSTSRDTYEPSMGDSNGNSLYCCQFLTTPKLVKNRMQSVYQPKICAGIEKKRDKISYNPASKWEKSLDSDIELWLTQLQKESC